LDSQGVAATDEHINVGCTALKAFLFAPLLITGASRTKGNITMTYVRSPEWLAANKERKMMMGVFSCY
jgi:hypothetical protein